MVDGQTVERIVGPCVFVSGAGVRKVLFIEETMTWLTVHPTEETDVEKLEEALVEKSGAWLADRDARDAKDERSIA
jgi:hypothetical protein